jgi:hypothetical protein
MSLEVRICVDLLPVYAVINRVIVVDRIIKATSKALICASNLELRLVVVGMKNSQDLLQSFAGTLYSHFHFLKVRHHFSILLAPSSEHDPFDMFQNQSSYFHYRLLH